MMRMLSLCSGIGGADLAASWAGIEITGQVEIDPFCQQVLAKHWPLVKRMGDIRNVQGNEFGEIDIIVAGFPCQPNSVAGKRQGSQDERNLWPEVKRIIGAAQPRWVVGENVCGLLTVESGRFFGSILSDLVTLGYRVGWGVYGACEVGAPHRRERVFIVAYSSRQQCQRGGNIGKLAGTPRANQSSGQEWEWIWDSLSNSSEAMADTQGNDERGLRIGETQTFPRSACSSQDVANASCQRLQGSRDARGIYTPTANAPASTKRRDCTRDGGGEARTAKPGVGRDFTGFPTRLDRSDRWPTRPGEPQHSWEPPRTITEKVPDRAKRLKALGNAIVPQQIYPIFEQIIKIEEEDGRE